ncbi:hypothetical protein SMACR_09786 [Sordaria macrospora]|uniref:Uncharacterized protein n=1 Tax=Sordaria macrospora TaxID=5147 RepID=A0A8S8Z924_SORMA|nr:hypothetical protein SMACR_09786 [Sordaria macrospora]WPJ64232.1 hypothetical protein SMAC4_09786 [Sordaria macrospora]
MEKSSEIIITAPSPDAPANYSVDPEIQDFFTKTSATRAACDAKAKELVDGSSARWPRVPRQVTRNLRCRPRTLKYFAAVSIPTHHPDLPRPYRRHTLPTHGPPPPRLRHLQHHS